MYAKRVSALRVCPVYICTFPLNAQFAEDAISTDGCLMPGQSMDIAHSSCKCEFVCLVLFLSGGPRCVLKHLPTLACQRRTESTLMLHGVSRMHVVGCVYARSGLSCCEVQASHCTVS